MSAALSTVLNIYLWLFPPLDDRILIMRMNWSRIGQQRYPPVGGGGRVVVSISDGSWEQQATAVADWTTGITENVLFVITLA